MLKAHMAVCLMATGLIAVPALAQTSTTANPSTTAPATIVAPVTTPAGPAGSTMGTNPNATTTTNSPATTTQRAENANRPLYEMRQGQWRSTKVVGLDVYNNNNEDIGEINDLILGQNGQIEAVVIGVGGFLGLGEHNVAVPFNQVRFMEEPRNAARPADGTAARPTTTTGANAPMTTNPPAANTTGSVATNNPAPGVATGAGTVTNPPAANTTGTVATNTTAPNTGMQMAAGDAYRGYPDHAMVNMTKDQLQTLPQVRYAR